MAGYDLCPTAKASKDMSFPWTTTHCAALLTLLSNQSIFVHDLTVLSRIRRSALGGSWSNMAAFQSIPVVDVAPLVENKVWSVSSASYGCRLLEYCSSCSSAVWSRCLSFAGGSCTASRGQGLARCLSTRWFLLCCQPRYRPGLTLSRRYPHATITLSCLA